MIKWTSARVYLAHAMSGRPWGEVLAEENTAMKDLLERGIMAFGPAWEEWHKRPFPKPWEEPIDGELDALQDHWRKDKREIVKAHVIVDLTPHLHSHGVSHEIGFARYCLWKPVVRIMEPTASVAYLEDDLLVPTVEAAAEAIQGLWGTRWLRWKWRGAMLARSLPKWIWRQVLAWS